MKIFESEIMRICRELVNSRIRNYKAKFESMSFPVASLSDCTSYETIEVILDLCVDKEI